MCQILNTLAQNALKHLRWQWKKPVIPREELEPENTMDEAMELTAGPEMQDDEIQDDFSDDNDDAFIDTFAGPTADAAGDDAMTKELLTADVDAVAWRAEVCTSPDLPDMPAKPNLSVQKVSLRAHTPCMALKVRPPCGTNSARSGCAALCRPG